GGAGGGDPQRDAARAGAGRPRHDGRVRGGRQRRAAGVLHQIVAPPSTLSTWPVTKLAAGEARKTTAPFSSPGWPRRLKGVSAAILSSTVRTSDSVMRVGK